MLITREGIIQHWLSEPPLQECEQYLEFEGARICLDLGHVSFPDLNELSSDEKRLFRALLEKHPEYLRDEVWAGKTIQ